MHGIHLGSMHPLRHFSVAQARGRIIFLQTSRLCLLEFSCHIEVPAIDLIHDAIGYSLIAI